MTPRWNPTHRKVRDEWCTRPQSVIVQRDVVTNLIDSLIEPTEL